MEPAQSPRKLGPPPLGRILDDPLPMARRARLRSEAERRRFVTRSTRQRSATIQERWRFLVEGTVQGVGFRQACRRRAMELGLSGWVRNLDDGRVEVQAEGEQLPLNELRLWCEQGPSDARVRLVRPCQIPITGADWFEIRH